ncbi:dTDP-4-dehydrorhamnose reductase [Flavobacteriaceae bacterium]|nr:dTDP-4-dehydrorhamnose reductase [Flavobacteriaceae bacterium]
MYKILVTGGNGQLGSEIKELSSSFTNDSFFFTDTSNLDITNHAAVAAFIKINDIDVIVNCAAYTAVDKAESEPKLVDAINHLAVKNLAIIAKERGAKLIHISTDYVFDGTSHKPYVETDTPNPQSVYGQTKLDGELAIQAVNPSNSIIIRTSWVYSTYGSNFVKTMLRIGQEHKEISVVSDQIGSPTYAGDLAKVILKILPTIKNEQVAIYHFTNSGTCSWSEFAKAIFKIKGMEVKVHPITTSQYPTLAKRPQYSVMKTGYPASLYNLNIPQWKAALERCLKKMS